MASFFIVGYVTATDNCIFTLEKMWLQITILRPHVVLKDLFDVKSFSAQFPGLLMAKQNQLEKLARNFSYTINLNETVYIALFCFFLLLRSFKSVFYLEKA